MNNLRVGDTSSYFSSHKIEYGGILRLRSEHEMQYGRVGRINKSCLGAVIFDQLHTITIIPGCVRFEIGHTFHTESISLTSCFGEVGTHGSRIMVNDSHGVDGIHTVTIDNRQMSLANGVNHILCRCHHHTENCSVSPESLVRF